jgi:branched-chain amino acid transport system ATP-binding protein
MASDLILRTQGLGKDFGGFAAVHSIDLAIERGGVHALIGPNGAGKTTCFNLLTRFLPASRGRIFFNDTDITHTSPQSLARRGMVRSFQISSVFPHLSVMDNLRLALAAKGSVAYQFWRGADALRRHDERAHALLDTVGLSAEASRLAVELPYGHKRALELATTLATDPELMLLDEPTQGMGHEDVGRVTELIARVAQGRTILMVEHNMKVVQGLCRSITVMSRGRVLAQGSFAAVSSDARVLEAYLGVESPDPLSAAVA